MQLRHCVIKIGSASDGSLQARVAVEEPSTGRSADQLCNSGETRKLNLSSEGRMFATFAPYPTPPGNIPHGIPPNEECVLFVQCVFGSAALNVKRSDGNDSVIDGNLPEMLRAKTGTSFLITMVP